MRTDRGRRVRRWRSRPRGAARARRDLGRRPHPAATAASSRNRSSWTTPIADDREMATARRADMFTADGNPSDDDPREHGPTLGDERATLVESLRCQRLTLEMKCADLDAEAMARRSVPPSTMSLLGLVRHLADGERATFRVLMAEPRDHRGRSAQLPRQRRWAAVASRRLCSERSGSTPATWVTPTCCVNESTDASVSDVVATVRGDDSIDRGGPP